MPGSLSGGVGAISAAALGGSSGYAQTSTPALRALMWQFIVALLAEALRVAGTLQFLVLPWITRAVQSIALG